MLFRSPNRNGHHRTRPSPVSVVRVVERMGANGSSYTDHGRSPHSRWNSGFGIARRGCVCWYADPDCDKPRKLGDLRSKVNLVLPGHLNVSSHAQRDEEQILPKTDASSGVLLTLDRGIRVLEHIAQSEGRAERGEFEPEVACMGSSIVDVEGKPVGAYAVSPPGARFLAQKNAMSTELLRVGNAASRWLGCKGDYPPINSDKSAMLTEEHQMPTTAAAVPDHCVESSGPVVRNPS